MFQADCGAGFNDFGSSDFFLLLSGKNLIYGFREAGPLCETHCKPQSGTAVGGQGHKGRFPGGGLMPLVVSRMYKSRFAEHYSTHTVIPTAAPLCGLQWVLHRGVPSAHPERIMSCLRNDRRSSVPLDNTTQAIHNSYNEPPCLVLSSGTLDLLSFYFFTLLLFYF